MAGRSGGGPGLPARRPGAAGPGEWEGWGKGRGLSPLEIHSYTPLATCRASAALETPGSLGSPSWGRVPGGFPRQLRPTSGLPIPRVSGTPPSPRCRGARAPSQAPQCLPPLYINRYVEVLIPNISNSSFFFKDISYTHSSPLPVKTIRKKSNISTPNTSKLRT